MLSPAQLIVRALMSHEGAFALTASTLRALDDEQAGRWLRRHVRALMADALLGGYEGHEPTPRRPGIDHLQLADTYIGMQILRDVGPRGLAEIDWVGLGRQLSPPKLAASASHTDMNAA